MLGEVLGAKVVWISQETRGIEGSTNPRFLMAQSPQSYPGYRGLLPGDQEEDENALTGCQRKGQAECVCGNTPWEFTAIQSVLS